MRDNSTKYLIEFPELMPDWDASLNPEMDPAKITSGSHISPQWCCHKCGRIWRAQVKNRVKGNGCTCDAAARKTATLRRGLVRKRGSLVETRPDLAAQWHPTLNGDITPDKVTATSTYKAWWIDSSGNVWQEEVAARNRGKRSAAIPQNHLVEGVNDLAATHPTVASQWHPTKNGELRPNQFLSGSRKSVWWVCEKGHEHQCTVFAKAHGRGCPVCTRERSTSFPEQAIYFYIKDKFPDAINRYVPEPRLEMDIYLPEYNLAIEYDGVYYHNTTRKQQIDARKNERLQALGIRLIRVIEEGGKIPDGTEFAIMVRREKSKWQLDAAIADACRIVNQICGTDFEYDIGTERDRAAIMEQYILLEKENSMVAKAPELLKEWHPARNGMLKPEYIQVGSSSKVWWLCGKCGFAWQASPYNRVHGQGCPVCCGNKVEAGINDLCTTHPLLAKEWHPEKNGSRLPSLYSAGSNARIWWKCGACDFEWEALIANRSRDQGCPRCAGKVASPELSLAATYPELAAQWHPTLNGNLTPVDVLPGSDKPVYWLCEKGHHWKVAVHARALQHHGCPYCSNILVWPGFNDLATVHPELLSQWDADNDVQPDQVLAGSTKKYIWRCEKGHTWKASIYDRIHGRNCPYCANRKVWIGYNDLVSTHPQLASEWNREKNGDLTPKDVTAGSNKNVWWKCPECHGEWQARVFSRRDGRGCPFCAGKLPIVGKNDLATVAPLLAAEWDCEKNGDLSPELVVSGSEKIVWWRCSKCGHEWKARISARSKGFCKCPECRG